jgi:integrase
MPSQTYLLRNRKDPRKCLSESALNGALKRMGYQDRLTGHGMRGTFSTAFNEIGYPDAWIEAQLSHSDPNRVRAAYNHAEYVEQRRRMMQDWADRLDLLEQGQVEEASRPLIVHLETVSRPEMPEQPFAHAA